MVQRRRVVGTDFTPDPVLQRGHDLAARRVVLRVGGERQQKVQGQTQRVSLDLDIALLHDVEQSNLDLPGQVRQFIDCENSAVGAGQQSVVDCQLVGNVVAPPSCLDWIDIPDHVGNRHIGSRQFFDVAVFGCQPGNRRVATRLGHQQPASAADGGIGIVVDFTPRDVRCLLIEECRQHADQLGLGLAAQSQQDEVVLGQHRVHQLRHHRVLIARNTGKQRLPPLELGGKVGPQLVLHAAVDEKGPRPIAFLKLRQVGGEYFVRSRWFHLAGGGLGLLGIKLKRFALALEDDSTARQVL